LYSLNDLHKASGSDQKHKPALFLRHDQTQALISEMSKGTNSYLLLKTTKGRYGSTYACRELVIAYAAWISAAFHLQVIRVFLDSVEQGNPSLPPPIIPNPPQPSRALEAAFLIGQLQLTLARDLLPALLREIENGNASWRNRRWLLHFAGDDQGALTIPRLAALPASALLPNI